MNANVVFAGGGAKGLVLAGCLAAVEQARIVPTGFGGSSAGSIIATLASVGYSGDELRTILLDTDFASLLDDGGTELNRLKHAWNSLANRLESRSYLSLFALQKVAGFFSDRLGLYDGTHLRRFLSQKIEEKVALQRPGDQVTFNELVANGCRPLRVVATDASRRRAIVLGANQANGDLPVVDAVMASSSFPFVFKPVRMGRMLLCDGGLSSNLPAFLFEREYRESRTPTLAFDLVLPEDAAEAPQGNLPLGQFVQSLLASSLEASDVLLRSATPGVQYFPIRTPLQIDTLDFALSRPQRESCFEKGFAEATRLLQHYEPIRRSREFGGELQKRMILQYGPVRLYQPILRALIEQLASAGQPIQGPRAHVMLLTGKATERAASTRIVTYSIGMEHDADVDLELDQDGGCSGLAWETGGVAVADLDAARGNPSPWKMSVEQHNKVPARIRSMISVAIPGNVRSDSAPERPIGTLAVDCETRLADTGWCADGHDFATIGPANQPSVPPDVATLMSAWATVVGAVLP